MARAVNKSDLVQKLREEGKSEEEIAKAICYLTKKSDWPKRKGINPSTNKEHISLPPINIPRRPKY